MSEEVETLETAQQYMRDVFCPSVESLAQLLRAQRRAAKIEALEWATRQCLDWAADSRKRKVPPTKAHAYGINYELEEEARAIDCMRQHIQAEIARLKEGE